MSEDGFFRPMASALALLPRVPSLVVGVVLLALTIWVRRVQTQPIKGVDPSELISRQLLTTLVPTLIALALIFLLARTLVAPQEGSPAPLYGRFLGLFVAMEILGAFITGMGTIAIFTYIRSHFMMTYGSVLVGSLGSIVTFPFLIRSLVIAAGADEPRLGGVIAFVFDKGCYIYLWSALCALLFPVLMVFTFANILSPQSANDLPGNALQSLISVTGSLLRYLLATVAALSTRPSKQGLAETFA